MITPCSSLLNGLKWCLLNQKFSVLAWKLGIALTSFDLLLCLCKCWWFSRKSVACMNIQSWLNSLIASYTHKWLNNSCADIFFILSPFFFNLLLTSTHLLTWSRFDVRLQPKDPIVASSFCLSGIWLYIFCGWRAFALQNLRGLLVVFTVVLFRILPVASECIEMLFDTLSAFL